MHSTHIFSTLLLATSLIFPTLCKADNYNNLTVGPDGFQDGNIDEVSEQKFYHASSCLDICMRSHASNGVRACAKVIMSEMSKKVNDAEVLSSADGQICLQGVYHPSQSCADWYQHLVISPISQVMAEEDPRTNESPILKQCMDEKRAFRVSKRNQCLPTCPTFYEEAGSNEATNLLKKLATVEQNAYRRYGSYITDIGAVYGAAQNSSFPETFAYKIGFVRAITDAIPVNNSLHAERMNSDYILPIDAGARKVPFSVMSQYCPDCTATKVTFKAVAFADLFGNGNFDIWTIDQTGNIAHILDALPH